MLDNYNGATPPGTFTLVQIHLDSYAIPWGSSRATFYGVTGVPTAEFDGVLEAEGAYDNTDQMYNWYMNLYNQRHAISTDVTIELSGAQVSGPTWDIRANVCIEGGGAGKTMRIYMVHVLDHWPTAVTYSRNGLKLAATSTQDITLAPGQCQQVTRTFAFDTYSWSHQSDMKMIAWAQTTAGSGPANIYQAAEMVWPFVSDCNDNDIPDECDIDCELPDCNVPGCGQSDDCDGNGVPDECQPDCNGNDIADPCDIAAGTSQDCQPNTTPDECELAGNDCNANNVPDDCDIATGTSTDCDTNGIPDECEIAGHDCNGNGTLDVCDIDAGTSQDCQPDGIPDDCQLAGNDCNGNSIPDDCDINVALPVSISFNLDSNPGWSTESLWAFGVPAGLGSHNHDPSSGYTGSNVYGYNLNGDYASNIPNPGYFLTTTALNCSGWSGTELRFYRWLGVERYDRAIIDVSKDGTNWTRVFTNSSTVSISEYEWSYQTYNISAVANGQAAVYLRWGMGPTDGSTTYPGWNIDDIEIHGFKPLSQDCNANDVPDECDVITLGDYNADGNVDLADYPGFVECLAGPGVPPQLPAAQCVPACLAAFDFDADNDVDLEDFAAFTVYFAP